MKRTIALRHEKIRPYEHTRFDDGLVLHYQPLVHAVTGQLSGFEALLRAANQPGPGAYPSATIERLGVEGAFHQLDRWAIRRAIADGATLRDAGIAVPIHVNIAVAEINDDLPEAFEQWLKELGDQTGRTVLEILETSHITNTKHARSLIEVCHQIGIKVAFDDFGVGQATLLTLQALHPDIVKIDRQFVQRLPQERRTRTIVHSLVDLAQKLGVHTVAEGVENRRQWDWLRDIGCDEIQGFVVSTALSAPDSVIRWHNEWAAMLREAARHGVSPAQAAADRASRPAPSTTTELPA